MASLYSTLDCDTSGDGGQSIQDAANGLHLHVHVVLIVHGEGGPAQLFRSENVKKTVNVLKMDCIILKAYPMYQLNG